MVKIQVYLNHGHGRWGWVGTIIGKSSFTQEYIDKIFISKRIWQEMLLKFGFTHSQVM